MSKRVLLLLVLLVTMIGGVVAFRMFTAKVPQAADSSVDAEVSAAELYNAFISDETAAGQQFNDKVVAVTGTVREVTTEADGRANVVLETGDALGGIVCEFPPGTDHGCMVNKTATIKGFCAGYNLDVLLQRCASIK